MISVFVRSAPNTASSQQPQALLRGKRGATATPNSMGMGGAALPCTPLPADADPSPAAVQEEEEGPASPWYATSTDTDLDSLLGSIPEEGESRLHSGSPAAPAAPHLDSAPSATCYGCCTGV
jgi:hypothetical protein